ncbi:UDP-N-acetylglucosamine transporter TMEM241 homolog [Tubulanus polymorphus]|uniref:UDP-N-acetylglucosamine transporter TMEM241 homolog n=1 Tax=Tubulanus polymorphus TaxID=672921 RepID=UPI003DA1E143
MIKTYQVQIAFILLSLCTVFVNKYVLTILKFTYPTIFQGWQTLVGAIVLRLLCSHKKIKLNFTTVHRNDLFRSFPCLILFVISIYSGSKALSKLPIPIFLVLHSLTSLITMIGEVAIHRRVVFGIKYILVMLSMASAVMAARQDIFLNPVAYKWMIVHILSSGVMNVWSSVSESKVSAIENLFMKYVFSVVILAPSSVFLGDALAARNFEYLYFYKFYVGCVFSGVYGVFLNLCTIRLKARENTNFISNEEFMESIAKIFTAFLSIFVFGNTFPATGIFWMVVNFGAVTFLSYISWSQHRTIITTATMSPPHLLHSSPRQQSPPPPSPPQQQQVTIDNHSNTLNASS